MPSRIALNGAALNGSSVSRLLGAGVFAAAATCAFAGTAVRAAAATPLASASIAPAIEQTHQGRVSGQSAAFLSAPNSVLKMGAAAIAAHAIFDSIVAPAAGGAVFAADGSVTAVATRGVLTSARNTGAAAFSSSAYGWLYPSANLSGTSRFVSEPGSIIDGVTTFNASGAFGSGGTVAFTVTGVHIMAINAGFSAVAGVMVSNPTYKYRALAAAASNASVAVTPKQKHKAVVNAATGRATVNSTYTYRARATAALSNNSAFANSATAKRVAAVSPTGVAGISASGFVRRFAGYVYASGLGQMSAQSYQWAPATAVFNCAGLGVMMADSSLRYPDAIEILRPAEDREFIRAPEAREFMRTAT